MAKYRRTARLTAYVVGLAMLTSCAAAPLKKPSEAAKVALVLGGGGARGFAHVGVIRELEKERIPIDLIVGVSVGSLVGSLYADSGSSFDLEWKAFKIEKNDIFDLGIFNLRSGLAKGQRIRSYIDKNISAKRIEELKISVAIVAVDLKTGKRVVFTSGPIREAICASAAIPGVFEPVPYNGMFLVDGAVLGNLAPEVARDLGADVIIGVNIAKQRTRFDQEPPGVLTTILESIGIMGDELVRLNRDRFDVLIEPDVGSIGVMDFEHKRELMEAGMAGARQAMPKIQELIAHRQAGGTQ